MSFLNMAAFFLLLAAPLLVLLYFLKLKRPQLSVPSTLLWQKVIEDMRVNSPFQKLRRSLLMLLQLLALLAIIFALARPLLNVRQNVNESLIVLLDNSASMRATEEDGKTRLQLAKSEILKLSDNMSDQAELMLIVFNARAKVMCAFTSNKRALRETISGVEATECPTDAQPALLLAKSICNSKAHPRVLLFSDGGFAEPRDIEMPVEIECRIIGSSRPNLAITGLDIRRSLNDRSKIEMFVAAENFSKESLTGNMIVRLDDRMLDSKYFSVGPRESLSQIFEADLPEGGDIKVEFDAKDSLACDNSAWKVVTPPARRRVLIVGENTFFLERVFRASLGIQCETATADGYAGVNAGEYSTVIWNSVSKPALAPCNNIYLGCFPETPGLKPGAKIDAPDILDWDNTHRVNRFIDFDNLIVSAATSMTLPEYGVAVLRSTHTPLIGLFEAGDGCVCVVGFDPIKSNWPLLVSFPLFINNCLEYFEDLQSRRFERNISVGKTITATLAQSAPSIQIPGGRREVMKKNPNGEYGYADVNRCGIYRIQIPNADSYSVAANLFDRGESLLDVTTESVIDGKKIKAMQAMKQMNREYWKQLVMILAALLVVEWIVYHRRLFV